MLSAFTSQKFRFWAFVSMFLLVFVHGYNLNENYLQPWTLPQEQLSVTTFTQYWLANGLFRFRIPMLFVISGYLFALGDYKPNKERNLKRVRTLLYPYLLWSAAGLLLTFILELFVNGREVVAATNMMRLDESRVLLHQYRWYEVLARWIFFPVSYQLWFIRVLLMYNLAYPALRYCVLNKKARWIFFSFAFLAWISTAGIILIEGEGLLFFTLGIWLQKENFNIDKPNKWMQPKYWIFIFIGLSILKTWMAFTAHFNGIAVLLIVCHKLVVVSGLIVAWYGLDMVVKYCMDKPWFIYLTSFAFMIYAFHAPAILYLNKAVFIFMPHFYGYRLATFMFLPLLLIGFCIIAGVLLRKYFPGFYSFATGGRGL